MQQDGGESFTFSEPAARSIKIVLAEWGTKAKDAMCTHLLSIPCAILSSFESVGSMCFPAPCTCRVSAIRRPSRTNSVKDPTPGWHLRSSAACFGPNAPAMATIATTPILEKDRKEGSVDSIMDEKLPMDDKESGEFHPDGLIDLKAVALSDDVGDVFDNVRAIDLGADGKERPIETDSDYALRLISLEDDPSLPIFTFRMWFLALGLSCFGAVLGQIFIFAFIIGKIMEEIIPGPSVTARIKTRDNRFWRFMNPGPFNIKEHVSITIMASTASSSALAISIFAAQDLYYNIRPNPATGIFT
ncbi:hypothetical protein NM688_g8924 [Phlebia brevispora]|uniref:Uncharacterized protein n=1 Tax=Phlebia brevispora TaxID=194682 RepID=A0ACC1RQ07_9APHY|nr:hypothetical protein NM688_g8924 [Phlebia brevispora]